MADTRTEPVHSPPLLTLRQAATYLGVSEKTVRRWIESKELIAAKLGAQWRIRPKDLELFVKERLEW